MGDAYSMDEDTVLEIAAPGLLGNDSDIDGDYLTAVLVADVTSGTLVLSANGSFIYTPEVDLFGTVTFTYVAHGSMGDSNAVMVNITGVDVPEESAKFTTTYRWFVNRDPDQLLSRMRLISPG